MKSIFYNIKFSDSSILPNGDMWITGGRDYGILYLNSTDIIDKDFNIIRGPDLPFNIYNHCIVNWNNTHMILIGGKLENRIESRYFMHSSATFTGFILTFNE